MHKTVQIYYRIVSCNCEARLVTQDLNQIDGPPRSGATFYRDERCTDIVESPEDMVSLHTEIVSPLSSEAPLGTTAKDPQTIKVSAINFLSDCLGSDLSNNKAHETGGSSTPNSALKLKKTNELSESYSSSSDLEENSNDYATDENSWLAERKNSADIAEILYRMNSFSTTTASAFTSETGDNGQRNGSYKNTSNKSAVCSSGSDKKIKIWGWFS
jgi:hypothetical protein